MSGKSRETTPSLFCFSFFRHNHRPAWQSVEILHKRLVDAKVVLVVGNGGIALELVHSLVSTQTCQVWGFENCRTA